jgi:DNA repair protein RadA/Sms
MPKKSKKVYVCSNCGAQVQTWAGRCPQCLEWNTIQENIDASVSLKETGSTLKTLKIEEIKKTTPKQRLKSGINEIDDVLGGGIVPGSICLLAGQPGIGKSTILMQIADLISKDYKVAYISGEESSEQVAMRATRLGSVGKNLTIASSNSANDIAATIATNEYQLVIVDSIQTMACQELTGAPGTISQITNSTQLITTAAKHCSTAVIIVGHVTKEGSIAGPKMLEHMVDVVLNIEGDRYGGFKLLRAVKNRFGSTENSGIFEMKENGLSPVANPSEQLLKERQVTDGSIVLATMEGNRPVLVEIQALVNTSTYGYPKRTASGYDINRLNLLIAVLEKRTKLQLADKDVYINVVGGLKIQEPAADLAVCMAIGSAAKGLTLKTDAVVFGEVGLSGEVRTVPSSEKRITEASKLGFKQAIGPKQGSSNTALKAVPNIKDALNSFLK